MNSKLSSEVLAPTPSSTMEANPSAEASTKSGSATTNQGAFTIFPNLPVELQMHICNAAREPRIVEVRFYHDGRTNKHKYFAQQPVLLRVCQQSRNEASRHYREAFTNKWVLKMGVKAPVKVPIVYFDLDIDILFINFPRGKKQLFGCYLLRQKTTDLALVQRLAIPESNRIYLAEIMAKFSGLDELMVTMNRENVHHSSHTTCSWPGIGLHDVEEVKAICAKSRYPFQLASARCEFSEFEQVGLFPSRCSVSFCIEPELGALLPSSLSGEELPILI